MNTLSLRGLTASALFLLLPMSARAVITTTGVVDKTRYTNSVTFTIAGATSATLDGVPISLGTPVTVTSIGFHDLQADDGVPANHKQAYFIVRNSERLDTEDGIPTMKPYHFVNDAPSAFAAGTLKLMVPSRYPNNLILPVEARLAKANDDPLFLNGVVKAGNFPASPLQLRRGWGSTILPAQTAITTTTSTSYDANVNGATATAPIVIEPASAPGYWTAVTGAVTGSWPANSRIHMTGTVTVANGATLTIGAGTIVWADPGVNIEVAAGGSVVVNGTVADPVVIAPASSTAPWGGVWLRPTVAPAKASFVATGLILCRWGADPAWTNSAHGFSAHRSEQAAFGVADSAILTLTDCAMIGPINLSESRGSGIASNKPAMNLTRVLCQRAITGGEQVQGSILMNNCAFIEFNNPNMDVDSEGFVDGDNDGLYLFPNNGNTHTLNNTLVGWTKDDGIDTGGSNGGSTIMTGCWFENCVHEAVSNSGGNRIPESHYSVHFNSGQAMECGYGDASVGPQSLVDHSLLIGNMVGARYGDNYGSGSWTYGGTFTMNDSLSLYNGFHDAWAIEWTSWAYQNARMTIRRSYISKAADLANWPGAGADANHLWNPATDGPQLSSYMPVPDSNVGVDLLLDKRQDHISGFPASVNVRLSTFSSKTVTTKYNLIGKPTPESTTETVISTGTLTWTPGETVKSVALSLPVGHPYNQVCLCLSDPVNAEVTGSPAFYFKYTVPSSTADFAYVPAKSTGWSYSAKRDYTAALYNPDLLLGIASQAPENSWKGWNHNEAITYGASVVFWNTNKTAPIGFRSATSTATLLLGTTLTAAEQGPSNDRTKAMYCRKKFTIEDPSVDAAKNVGTIKSLTLKYWYDDAAVIYLNGTELLARNISKGAGTQGYTYTTSTGATVDANTEGDAVTVVITDAGLLGALRTGVNVLAAEVHQGSLTSSDLVWDCQVTAQFKPAPTGIYGLGQLGSDHYFYWLDTDILGLETSPNLGAGSWTKRPDQKSPVPLIPTATRMFYRAKDITAP